MATPYYLSRGFRYRGKLTTIKLEPEWWQLLSDLCDIQERRMCEALSEIEKKRGAMNRAAAVRFYVGHSFSKLALLHIESGSVGAMQDDDRFGA